MIVGNQMADMIIWASQAQLAHDGLPLREQERARISQCMLESVCLITKV